LIGLFLIHGHNLYEIPIVKAQANQVKNDNLYQFKFPKLMPITPKGGFRNTADKA
jgi:hypothetical protein